MIDSKFNEWVKEFNEDYQKSEAYKNVASRGHGELDQRVLGWYIQFKQHQSHEKLVYWTRWLVLATWTLCIATLLLVKLG